MCCKAPLNQARPAHLRILYAVAALMCGRPHPRARGLVPPQISQQVSMRSRYLSRALIRIELDNGRNVEN
jgi:hypothetical protein